MWDERFSEPGYFFGTEPALFVRAQAGHLPAGARILSVAEGEGRNAVWLAEQGHEVTAFEKSKVGLEKARNLARDQGVAVDFQEGDLTTWPWQAAAWDAVLAVFIQFVGPEDRARAFEGMKRAVRPGGLVLLHGYTPRQLDYGTGGSRQIENLYTEALLAETFGDFEILRLESYERELDEGAGHSGMSALIDLVARKPG